MVANVVNRTSPRLHLSRRERSEGASSNVIPDLLIIQSPRAVSVETFQHARLKANGLFTIVPQTRQISLGRIREPNSARRDPILRWLELHAILDLNQLGGIFSTSMLRRLAAAYTTVTTITSPRLPYPEFFAFEEVYGGLRSV